MSSFAALAAATAAQQADLATLQDAVGCYSSRLGLRLESAQGKHCMLPVVQLLLYSVCTAESQGHALLSLASEGDGAVYGTAAGRGELRVVFTQIDQGQPEREFFFGVHMQDDDVYEGGQNACKSDHNTTLHVLSGIQAHELHVVSSHHIISGHSESC